MSRRIYIGVLLWITSYLAAAEELKPSSDLIATFESARLKLPEPLRARVADVVLKRAEDLGIGADMPLEYRLLMAKDAEKMPRGEKSDLLAADRARFVNRYARYDPREDYAESFRMMAYEPERLAKIAPEKFLYLNALGWNARLDAGAPGPLWYSGKELESLLPKEV